MQFPCPPLADLQARFRSLCERLQAAARLPAEIDGALFQAPTALPANLGRLVYTLPASEAHHDTDAGGLLRHSLDVALTTVEIYRSRIPEPAGGRQKPWMQTLVALLITALLHDLGQLWFLDVRAGGTSWSIHRYLADFVLERNAPHLEVRHRPGRVRSGPDGHEPLALVFLNRIVPMGILPWLGSRAMNDLLATLTCSLGGQASDPVYGIVAEADARSTAAALQRAPRTTIPAPRYQLGSGTLADEFVHGFRLVLGSPLLRCNVPDGHLLMSPSHTVLFLSMAMPGEANIFRIIFNRMRQEVAREGIGGYLQKFSEIGDPHAFLDELATRSTAAGTSWCVPAQAADKPDGPALRHLAIASDAGGTRRRMGYCIVMRNEPLWGPCDASSKGLFGGRLTLLSETTKTPSADPEDLGFAAGDGASVPAAPASVRSLRSSAVLDSTRELLDLPTVVRQLVQELGALAPEAGSSEQLQHWQLLTSGSVDPGADAHILPALEACLDHLVQLRASARGGQRPPRAAEVAVPAAAVTGAATSSSATPDAARDQALDQIAAILAGLVEAARRTDLVEGPIPELVHAVRLPDGQVLLPWPQCLTELVEASTQVQVCTAQRTADLCTLLGLGTPTPVRLAGYPYRIRRHHKVLQIDPLWRSPVRARPLPVAPIIMMGQLAGTPAGAPG